MAPMSANVSNGIRRIRVLRRGMHRERTELPSGRTMAMDAACALAIGPG
jgi:hypothetical protein